MILKDIEKLIRLVEQSEIAELEWEKNKERIRIRKPGPAEVLQANMPAMVSVSKAAPAAQETATAATKTSDSGRNKEVLSPFVGTFYASPSPDAPRYVEAGQRVKKGDVLCIVEAMKIMNEIEAEFPGKVVAMQVKDGQPVQYGQTLFLIEP